MLSDTKKILDDALGLPENDRRHLAESLLDSIPVLQEQEIEQHWNHEAIGRANATLKGQITSLDGEEALGQLEQKLRRNSP